ncbi:MAG TPA: ABC transporter permease, partial [Vicinamibacterales bacterium]|nr:ABC transporter permease [Vicinamibacterales bacterium]
TAAGAPTVVIEARPETFAGTFQAMWRYRSFFGLLFRENLLRRARGTLLGFWWVILRPLMAAAGFIATFVFVAPLNTGTGVPYPVFFLSGFIPWRLFQATVTQLPRAVMRSRGMMSRTYFPRLLVPLAGFGQALIEVGLLCAVFVIVVATQWWTHPGQAPIRLGIQTVWLLPCLLGALAFAVAIGMVFGIVALFFRDVVFSLTYIVQLVMFVTPVLYPATFVPGSYRWLLYSLNPMAQMVTVSRWALTGQGAFEPFFVLLAFVTIAVVFAAAVVFFLRAERYLGDQL